MDGLANVEIAWVPLIIILIILLLLIISVTGVYKKAGYDGWKALVPIYGQFILTKISGLPIWYFILLFIPIANIYATVKIHIEVAKKFGKSTGFGIGLMFLPFVFYPLLLLSHAKYDWEGKDEIIRPTKIEKFDSPIVSEPAISSEPPVTEAKTTAFTGIPEVNDIISGQANSEPVTIGDMSFKAPDLPPTQNNVSSDAVQSILNVPQTEDTSMVNIESENTSTPTPEVPAMEPTPENVSAEAETNQNNIEKTDLMTTPQIPDTDVQSAPIEIPAIEGIPDIQSNQNVSIESNLNNNQNDLSVASNVVPEMNLSGTENIDKETVHTEINDNMPIQNQDTMQSGISIEPPAVKEDSIQENISEVQTEQNNTIKPDLMAPQSSIEMPSIENKDVLEQNNSQEVIEPLQQQVTVKPDLMAPAGTIQDLTPKPDLMAPASANLENMSAPIGPMNPSELPVEQTIDGKEAINAPSFDPFAASPSNFISNNQNNSQNPS